MSDDGITNEAWQILQDANVDPRGAKLNGRAQKKAARELFIRGFGQLNKSATRLKISPAGKFILANSSRIGATE